MDEPVSNSGWVQRLELSLFRASPSTSYNHIKGKATFSPWGSAINVNPPTANSSMFLILGFLPCFFLGLFYTVIIWLRHNHVRNFQKLDYYRMFQKHTKSREQWCQLPHSSQHFASISFSSWPNFFHFLIPQIHLKYQTFYHFIQKYFSVHILEKIFGGIITYCHHTSTYH